jgi:hypothetical protein
MLKVRIEHLIERNHLAKQEVNGKITEVNNSEIRYADVNYIVMVSEYSLLTVFYYLQ